MDAEELQEILRAHALWMRGKGGQRADLSGAFLRAIDLSDAELINAKLTAAHLERAHLEWAHLAGADLLCADLSGANLAQADLGGANLKGANLRSTCLSGSNLAGANLTNANLTWTNLNGVNLSGARGLLDPAQYLADTFEATDEGYIVYKTFGWQYASPESWRIEPGSVITEVVNPDRCTECASGVNVATREWLAEHAPNCEIWRCLLAWRDLPSVVVPYNTDGKIRCGGVTLLERVSEKRSHWLLYTRLR